MTAGNPDRAATRLLVRADKKLKADANMTPRPIQKMINRKFKLTSVGSLEVPIRSAV
jgi:hypothetical protein